MKRISASVIAFALVGWTACGEPELRRATDLGANPDPTVARLEVRNESAVPRAFMVAYSIARDSTPTEIQPSDADDRFVRGMLIAGQSLAPNGASPEFELALYTYRHAVITAESWDPATGEDRKVDVFALPGRLPATKCILTYRAAGDLVHTCE